MNQCCFKLMFIWISLFCDPYHRSTNVTVWLSKLYPNHVDSSSILVYSTLGMCVCVCVRTFALTAHNVCKQAFLSCKWYCSFPVFHEECNFFLETDEGCWQEGHPLMGKSVSTNFIWPLQAWEKWMQNDGDNDDIKLICSC